MAVKVTLRQKSIKGGRASLYLDFYPAALNSSGKVSRREFLSLYVYEPINREDIEKGRAKKPKYSKNPIENAEREKHNIEARSKATIIQLNWYKKLNAGDVLTDIEKHFFEANTKEKALLGKDFLEYFGSLMNKLTGSNYSLWDATYKHLKTFSKGKLKFGDVTVKFCDDFKYYLQNYKSDTGRTLSKNSVSIYFGTLKSSLKTAYKHKLLLQDINAQISAIPKPEVQRNYLTLAELNKLAQTECLQPVLKRAALFSALTGLRFIDLKNLRWKQVEQLEGGEYAIKFIQQKTGNPELNHISQQAFELMGEPGKPEQLIFDGLMYSSYHSKHLWQWLIKAGIEKKISFHCFRHSFAILQLEAGTDVFTISKMLGHRNLQTTMVYAKITDPKKREAANKIKLKF